MGTPTGGIIFAGPDVPQLCSISSSSVRSLFKAAASIRCLRSSRANSGREESGVPPGVYPAPDVSESQKSPSTSLWAPRASESSYSSTSLFSCEFSSLNYPRSTRLVINVCGRFQDKHSRCYRGHPKCYVPIHGTTPSESPCSS